MHYDVLIVGGGPAGLSCGRYLADKNVKTLIIERKDVIGPKSCAGGITWSGLIREVPESLIEQSFPLQYVKTDLQSTKIEEKIPIIATVNRKSLGQYMQKLAKEAGAHILTSHSLRDFSRNEAVILNSVSNSVKKITFDYLVGADGSTSNIRKYLGLPVKNVGIGINYQIQGTYSKMEWHLRHHYFQNGYGWIFPHSDSISIGAYVDNKMMGAGILQQNLIRWAAEKGFDLTGEKCTAGLINYDYRGFHFDNYFLVGDAAGLSSALTGEGIYPAIRSGQEIAKMIMYPSYTSEVLQQIIRRQKRFAKIVRITSKNRVISAFLSELGLLALRTKLVKFNSLEMASTP